MILCHPRNKALVEAAVADGLLPLHENEPIIALLTAPPGTGFCRLNPEGVPLCFRCPDDAFNHLFDEALQLPVPPEENPEP